MMTRSTTRANVYKPSYGGFVDMDIEEHKRSISLRTLVKFFNPLLCWMHQVKLSYNV